MSKPDELNIIDKLDMPFVVKFIKEQLTPYDTSKVEWFKLLRLKNHVRYHGKCTYPKRKKKGSPHFVRGYRIGCSLNPDLAWPYERDVCIGTETFHRDSFSRSFRYVTERVCFEDAEEFMACLAGHEAFHFLRHSKQIPGRNTEPSAERFGLEWLKTWRKWCSDPEIQERRHGSEFGGGKDAVITVEES